MRYASRLAIGTVQFGLPYGIANSAGQVSRADAKVMLDLAVANGVDTVDTAISYGESETCLGSIGTQGIKVVTKLPAVPDECPDVGAWVRQQLSASLLRLNVTTVYGLLLHRPDQLLGPNGAALYRAIQDHKACGRVKKLGVSIYAPRELSALLLKYRFDLVQAPFNIVDRRFYSSGWLHRLKDDGVEVHTRSAFLQGLLLMAQPSRPPKFAKWTGLWTKWHQWLADQDGSAVQACLAFPLSFPEIDRVIVGADNVIQLAQVLDAAKCQSKIAFPDLQCEDEDLINPAKWNAL